MIYLASPYTHTDERVQLQRATDVVMAVGKLLELKINAYSPIAHWCLYGASANKHSFENFVAHDKEMIDICNRFVILELHGWTDSAGIAKEYRYAHSIGRIIESCNFHDLTMGVFRPQIVLNCL